jgi:transcriptional regulator with GAF, ATPase, and Fis domain
MNTQAPQLTKGNIEQLQAYDWPGNVRELQNVVERAVIFAQTGALSFDFVRLRRATSRGSADLVAPTLRPAPTILTDSELKRRERDSILSALAQTNGKISGPRGAAELLGMKPTTLASRIKALGLKSKPIWTIKFVGALVILLDAQLEARSLAADRTPLAFDR